jgi:hypothetical protein
MHGSETNEYSGLRSRINNNQGSPFPAFLYTSLLFVSINMRCYSGPDKDFDLPELDLLTFLFGQLQSGPCKSSIGD